MEKRNIKRELIRLLAETIGPFYHEEILDEPYINVRKRGETLFLNTTQCLHRAGRPEPGKSRLMLVVNLHAILRSKEERDLFFFEETNPSLWDSRELITSYIGNVSIVSKLVQDFKRYIFFHY